MGDNPIDRRTIVKARIAVAAFIGIMAVALGIVIGTVAAGDDVTNQPMPAQVITVTGGATVTAAPDEAVVRVGVRTEADTSEDAYRQNADKTEAVMKALKGAGVPEDQIATTNISLDRRYENRGERDERIFYIAENEFEVLITDLDQVGPVTDAAVKAGANIVGGIEFRLSDQAAAKSDALTKAVEGARAKADTLAAAAEAEVGPVVRIDEENVDVRPTYERGFALEASDAAWGDAATPISPDDVEVKVSVRVIFELET